MKATAVICLNFPSQKHLEIISEALEPEIMKPATPRSQATLEKENAILILRIEAKDTVALRAAMNAYLRWINSLIDILKTLEKTS